MELWEKRLGFMRVADEEDHLGLAMLSRDGIVVMYQTWSSAAQDIAPLADEVRAGRQFLFVEVADLSAIEEQLRGIDYLIPKRRTLLRHDGGDHPRSGRTRPPVRAARAGRLTGTQPPLR